MVLDFVSYWGLQDFVKLFWEKLVRVLLTSQKFCYFFVFYFLGFIILWQCLDAFNESKKDQGYFRGEQLFIVPGPPLCQV